MLIKSIGRPCGPCCGIKKTIPLQTACLLIGFFEIFSIPGASYFPQVWEHLRARYRMANNSAMGRITGIGVPGELLGCASWISWMGADEFELMSCAGYSYGWQAICYYIFSILGGILLLAYYKRQTKWCLIWVIGAVVTQLVSIVGIFFMLDYLHPYHFLVAVMTILRAYFVWVILAFHREIVTYPGGYPPAQESLTQKDLDQEEETEPEVAAIKSSVKYVGDG